MKKDCKFEIMSELVVKISSFFTPAQARKLGRNMSTTLEIVHPKRSFA